MAEPPAPDKMMAVITGAASRTMPMASTAPTMAAAPIWTESPPTSSTSTSPKGMAMRMAGSTVTEIKNQACSANSAHENRRCTMAATVDQTASRSMEKMSPRIANADTTLSPNTRSSSTPQSTTSGRCGSSPLLPLADTGGAVIPRSVTERPLSSDVLAPPRAPVSKARAWMAPPTRNHHGQPTSQKDSPSIGGGESEDFCRAICPRSRRASPDPL